MKRRLCVCLAIILPFILSHASQAGLKVYYIRHAEGGHNVVAAWKNTPREQWPLYVGNPNMFTPKGETQIIAATEKLKTYHFDFIAVSPYWRTRNTIWPYLKAANAKAEIWPELGEFDGAMTDQGNDSNLPVPSAEIFTGGKPIDLTDEEKMTFSLRTTGQKQVKVASTKPQMIADRKEIMEKTVEMIRKRFGNTEKSILLVGHGNNGRLLLETLTQDHEMLKAPINNTGIWMTEEQPDGSFKLLMLNDKPYIQPRKNTLTQK